MESLSEDFETVNTDIQTAINQIISDLSKTNPFDVIPFLSEIIYKSNIKYSNLPSYPIVNITFTTPWNKLRTWYCVDKIDCEMDRCLEDFHKVFIKIRDRTKELQGNFDIQVFNIPVVQINDLAKKALGSKNERLKKELAEFHMMKMYDFYTAMKDKNNALIHGELSFLFDQVPADTQSSNNLGYLFLPKGNLQKARALFENALTKTNPLLEDTKIGIYSE